MIEVQGDEIMRMLWTSQGFGKPSHIICRLWLFQKPRCTSSKCIQKTYGRTTLFPACTFFSQHWTNRLTWPAQWFNTMSIAESRPAFSRLSWEAWRKTGGLHISKIEKSPKWQSPAVTPKPLTLPPRNYWLLHHFPPLNQVFSTNDQTRRRQETTKWPNDTRMRGPSLFVTRWGFHECSINVCLVTWLSSIWSLEKDGFWWKIVIHNLPGHPVHSSFHYHLAQLKVEKFYSKLSFSKTICWYPAAPGGCIGVKWIML